MPLDFKALFAAHQPPIDPATVLVLRHAPPQPSLRRVFKRLAADSPEVFNAYQQTQVPDVQNRLLEATYLASFIALPQGGALFVGLYERLGQRIMTPQEIRAIPAIGVLESHGLPAEMEQRQWFDLHLKEDFYLQWKGKLQIDWPPPPIAYHRWLDEFPFTITAIHSESQLGERPPNDCRYWDLRKDELTDLPDSWWARLAGWRAIYYVFDVTDGTGYVGKAAGNENLAGRWGDYVRTGHGGNVELMGRNYDNFRFSILELVGGMDEEEICTREQNWMIRLRTRTRPHGLNLPIIAD